MPNMEYEINTCALMKLLVVTFKASAIKQGRFLWLVLDVFYSYTIISVNTVQLPYHVNDLLTNTCTA